MQPNDYTPEQRKDIEERVEKARKLLLDLHLRPSASVSSVNLGEDMFAHKVFAYLQDTKYEPTLSPIQDV